MNYMSYGYPNQSGYNTMFSMGMPKGGSCCGTVPMSMPYTTQQMPQGMTLQQIAQQPLVMQPPVLAQKSPMASSGNLMTPSGMAFPLPNEQSFIENILRLNLGKVGTFYMTYENNSEWNAKKFRGVLEAAGRDHIIISDPRTGMRTILLMVNLDYDTFDEPLSYQYPYRQSASSTEEEEQ